MKLGTWVVAAAMSAGVCACNGGTRAQGAHASPASALEPASRNAPTGTDPARGIVAVTVPQSDVGDAALLKGTLEVERCVFVRGADGERRLLVLAMRPARWDDATSELVAGGKRFTAGQKVFASGSESDYDTLEGHWENAPRPSCRTAHVWVAHQVD